MEIHTDWHYTSSTNKEYVIKYRPTEDKYFSYRFLHSDDTGDYYAIGAKNVDDLPASIALPSEYDGYPVTCVNENGFRFAKGLKKIVIPEGYTDIGENAFEGCDLLEYVDLPDSLYSIGASSFYSCDNLKEIELPKNLYSLGRYSFSYSGLTHIEIPDRVELIGTSAFMFCYSLTDAFIGGRVRVLHDNAFEECTSLTTVTVMNKDITYIGTRAFALCSSLIAVNYNGTRDDWAKINVQKSWTYNAGEYVMLYSGDCEAYLDLYVYSSGYYVIAVNDKSALPEKLIIPTILYGCRVTGIDYNGFEDCAGIKELFIPYGIEFIGKEAFKGCTGLTSVSIPASVEWIYEEAFADCTNLKALVTSPCKELYIDERAFKNCDLRYVTLSTGLRGIYEEAFANNANLTDLVIPDGVTFLQGGIIKNCTSLYMLTIPKTVSYLREGIIDGNPSLSFISFTGTVAEWEELGKNENWCYESKTIPVGCTDGYASSNGKPLG